MQIHGQRIHGDDFAFLRADERGKGCRGLFVIGDPRTLRGVMAEHAQAPPVLHFLFDILRGRFGLKPERVAAQIHQSPPVAVAGMMELRPR